MKNISEKLNNQASYTKRTKKKNGTTPAVKAFKMCVCSKIGTGPLAFV